MKKFFGHVKWFDIDKGFGFLLLEDDEGDVLLHANVLKNFGRTSISEGTKIEFEFQETDKGRQVTLIHNILNSEDKKNPKKNDISLNKNNNVDFYPARVKWFNKSKGFGFANIFKSNHDIFLHVETLKRSGLSDLETGEAIVLSVTEGPRGKMADSILTWDDQILIKEKD